MFTRRISIKNLVAFFLLLSTALHAQCWQSVQCGNYHTVAVKDDGSVWAWGANFNGQLGDGTLVDKYSPVAVTNVSDWQSLFVGDYTNFIIKNNGSLWAWGTSYYGLFGNGSAASSYPTPSQIGNDYNWKFIASRSFYTIGLKLDGTLWATGSNNYGQFGNNTADNSYYFIQIGTDTDWDKISAGTFSSFGIKTNGSLWGWGSNDSGQLANSTVGNLLVPTQIGTDTDWVDVSGSTGHTLALKSNGTIWAWGNNSTGQLGIGNNTNTYVPVQVGTQSDWVSITTGDYFCLARKADHSVWFWGTGRRVNGSFVNTYTPIQISTSSDYNTISGGYKHLALTDDSGSLFTRGWNNWGQLGNGTTVSNYDDLTEVNCTALGNASFKTKYFSVFPVPTHDFLTIGNDVGKKIDRIAVFDLTGKKMMEQSAENTQVDVRSLQQGIYFITLDFDGGKQIDKFIKQ